MTETEHASEGRRRRATPGYLGPALLLALAAGVGRLAVVPLAAAKRSDVGERAARCGA